eukprot:8327518-Pyramimonas_sp.AAC.1
MRPASSTPSRRERQGASTHRWLRCRGGAPGGYTQAGRSACRRRQARYLRRRSSALAGQDVHEQDG